MATFAPFSRPLYVMAKPVGSLCNLACKYCYYLEKSQLYTNLPQNERFNMDDRTLETFISQYIESQTQPQVLFTWHGGEPLMRPISFYKRVLELQKRYARGRIIENCLQTNGTLLTDEWCEFFRANNWLIGISIDGSQDLHDEYRRARGGQPSFYKVMRGIRLLQKHGVEWNAMGVVNDYNADYPLDVYHFYKENGCQYIQFAPIIERILPHEDGRQLAHVADNEEAQLADFSVTPEQYAHFCCTIFDEWVRNDVGQVFVQLFDSTLARWVGEAPGVCAMAETCGHASVLEANGDLYSCDHFVFPEYKLGNIHKQTITEMMYSDRQLTFGRGKRNGLPQQCLSCPWLFVCNGGCPKDRFCQTANGERGLNYMCKAFQQIFGHVKPYMDFMKQELLCQRPPANVMEWARKQ
ncbi:anaerobic sulfatase-maturation protein [Prevotella sp. E13-17]|uniref:anaerobic sulfatase-maturation protein n=1 Tax=Prevotella sp. E13-17 TaxID=2913616 RepID=UPI001EDAC502|nr:anaerobic sulfatase-maturation protein [Prevotella sp. E13-17]UKK51674.1 anaerobic sulfatase-maturation protein [Prevotella sp. E13-17]